MFDIFILYYSFIENEHKHGKYLLNSFKKIIANCQSFLYLKLFGWIPVRKVLSGKLTLGCWIATSLLWFLIYACMPFGIPLLRAWYGAISYWLGRKSVLQYFRITIQSLNIHDLSPYIVLYHSSNLHQPFIVSSNIKKVPRDV